MIPLITTLPGQEADRAFMENLFDAHYARMRMLSYSILHDNGAAEDVAQDVLLYVFEHIEKFRDLDRSALLHLIDLIIRRRSYNALRSEHMRSKHSAGSLDDPGCNWEPADPDPPVEEQAILNIDAARMAQAIRRLSPDQRFAIEAKYLLGMNDAEIAAELGIKKNSVRQYLTRARRRVYKLMEDESDEKK